MAFTTQRYLINNLANADNITASSQGAGTIRQPKKTGTGTATLTPSGSYTGASGLLYTVQCDTAGSVDGAATFRWKTSDTAAGSWEATGVSATTSATSLSNGVSVTFSAGTLVLNDKWQFPVFATYGPGKLFLNDRDSFYKSAEYTDETAEFEQVTNGTFASDITGWSDVSGPYSGTVAWDAGTLKITQGGTSTWMHAYQALSLDEGKRYLLSVEVTAQDVTTALGKYAIGTTEPTAGAYTGDVLASTECGAVATYTAYFIAGATNYVCLSNGGAATKYINFDNISVKEVNCRLTIDLGSAQAITAIALLDHNLASGNWLAIQGNSSDSWESPSYELQLDETNDPEIEYITQTYRYWSFEISGYESYFSGGKLYVGTYSELTGNLKNIPWGSSKGDVLQTTTNRSEAGKVNSYVYSRFKAFETQYFPTRTSGDLTTLETVFEATFNLATGQRVSILVHFFYDESTTLYLCRCLTDRFDLIYPNYAHYEVLLAWEEEVMTRTI